MALWIGDEAFFIIVCICGEFWQIQSHIFVKPSILFICIEPYIIQDITVLDTFHYGND